jgi:hypothetical protein
MSKFQEGLQAQRQLVEQLRVEAGIHRMTVSESVAEIMKYMQQHAESDVLMKGFAKQSDNPFKEKGGCRYYENITKQTILICVCCVHVVICASHSLFKRQCADTEMKHALV